MKPRILLPIVFPLLFLLVASHSSFAQQTNDPKQADLVASAHFMTLSGEVDRLAREWQERHQLSPEAAAAVQIIGANSAKSSRSEAVAFSPDYPGARDPDIQLPLSIRGGILAVI